MSDITVRVSYRRNYLLINFVVDQNCTGTLKIRASKIVVFCGLSVITTLLGRRGRLYNKLHSIGPDFLKEKLSSILYHTFICFFYVGMGTLGIPYAIKIGGLSSIIYIVVIAVITCHTGGLIIEAQYDESLDDCDEEKETDRLKPRAGYASVGMF